MKQDNCNNSNLIGQPSRNNNIDSILYNRVNYESIFIIYKFIGFKYHKLVQQTINDNSFFFDVLSKKEIPYVNEVSDMFDERNVCILKKNKRIRTNDETIIVQKIKIDWNTLHTVIDIFKMNDLSEMSEYKEMVLNLKNIEISETIKDVVKIILLLNKKRKNINRLTNDR